MSDTTLNTNVNEYQVSGDIFKFVFDGDDIVGQQKQVDGLLINLTNFYSTFEVQEDGTILETLDNGFVTKTFTYADVDGDGLYTKAFVSTTGYPEDEVIEDEVVAEDDEEQDDDQDVEDDADVEDGSDDESEEDEEEDAADEEEADIDDALDFDADDRFSFETDADGNITQLLKVEDGEAEQIPAYFSSFEQQEDGSVVETLDFGFGIKTFTYTDVDGDGLFTKEFTSVSKVTFTGETLTFTALDNIDADIDESELLALEADATQVTEDAALDAGVVEYSEIDLVGVGTEQTTADAADIIS